MVQEIDMRMAAGAAPVVRLKSRRPGPKNCCLPIGNRVRVEKSMRPVREGPGMRRLTLRLRLSARHRAVLG